MSGRNQGYHGGGRQGGAPSGRGGRSDGGRGDRGGSGRGRGDHGVGDRGGGGRGRGDYGGGDRGGGRTSGGRFDQSGSGGRGRERQPSMADLVGQNMSIFKSAAILATIDPPAAEKDRSSIVRSGTRLPGHSDLRTARTPVAFPLGNGAIQSNHFGIDTANVPGIVFKYHVAILRLMADGIEKDVTASTDSAPQNIQIMLQLKEQQAAWHPAGGGPLGYFYDGKASLVTSRDLGIGQAEEDQFSAIVADGSRRYRVVIKPSGALVLSTDAVWWKSANIEVASMALGALLSSARNQQSVDIDMPEWYVAGSKLFKAGSRPFDLAPGYEGRQGFSATVRSCLAGPALVLDMTAQCFLASGTMIELVVRAGGFRDEADLLRACSQGQGLHAQKIKQINDVIRNCKVKAIHLGFAKKVKKLGPPASSSDSRFDCEGKQMTVAAYFELKARTDRRYKKLKFPGLPTANVGTDTHPVLIPIELLIVRGGQSRSHAMTPDMTALMIRKAAVPPQERFDAIVNNGVVARLCESSDAVAFGLNTIAEQPMFVEAGLLPPAEIQYGQNAPAIRPGLAGAWNMSGSHKVFAPPVVTDRSGSTLFHVVLVGTVDNYFLQRNGDWEQRLEKFTNELKREGATRGVKLHTDPTLTEQRYKTCTIENRGRCLELLKVQRGCGIVVLLMLDNKDYGLLKHTADGMGLTTQCIKWATVVKEPRGVMTNLMIKINAKLGGTNHTLVSRLQPADANRRPKTFQTIPASLSHFFDEPCMMIGIDVSHPEPGSDAPSIAAVVGSMDGSLSQYAAHISSQTSRVEMVSQLPDAIGALLDKFRTRNGHYPARIIVYRDGVSESQFDQVLAEEAPAIATALHLRGCVDNVKVSIVVCTKRHHTRLFYVHPQTQQRLNPCPGVLVDSTGGDRSITSAVLNEFYLNSHTAIQGTAKPCKYTLIQDEIGFKLSELELLTYWTTYLYARCNRSVSYATPAYYAHWASKRGKELSAAGATARNLVDISALWAQQTCRTPMFFI